MLQLDNVMLSMMFSKITKFLDTKFSIHPCNDLMIINIVLTKFWTIFN